MFDSINLSTEKSRESVKREQQENKCSGCVHENTKYGCKGCPYDKK